MNIDFINTLENYIQKSFQTAGNKLNENSDIILNKKNQINNNTEELLVDINDLLSQLDNKYIKIKQLETENNKKDKLDLLINNLEQNTNTTDNNIVNELDKINIMKNELLKEKKQFEQHKDNFKKNNKNQNLIDKVNTANNNNKQIEQLDILIDKNKDIKDESKLDKILLLKVISDMKKIIELVPENIDDELIKSSTLEIMKGGQYDEQFNNLPDKLNKFSNKYSNLLTNKSKLKKYVNNICDKYNNTNQCINIIFETFETINLNEQQIKNLDFNLNEIKDNNIQLLLKREAEIVQLIKNNSKNEELLVKIENKLKNNLNKYNQSYNKYIEIDKNVNNVYQTTENTDNTNIEQVILEYDRINKGLLNKLDELSNDNVNLEMKKHNIKSDINDNNDTVILLQTEVADLKNQLDIIQEANRKRINEFINKLNAIKKDKEKLTSDIIKLEGKISELEKSKNISQKSDNNNIDNKIDEYKLRIQKYKNMLEDANNWKIKINSQLLDIKNNLQDKINNFDEVELILNNIKNIDFDKIKKFTDNNISSNKLRFKIKDLTSQIDYLNNTKLNNEQKLDELNTLINKDDLTIQETRQKLKQYRDEIVENIK